MRKGHVFGTKKEKKDSQAWYDAIAWEHIRRIEAEAAAKQHTQQAQGK